jgi:hypothetical protein
MASKCDMVAPENLQPVAMPSSVPLVALPENTAVAQTMTAQRFEEMVSGVARMTGTA